ncbi:hypothetical protein [Sulfurimonas sp.]|jgi:hypothetical protein|uniref:hypothetical protein n=1 Tax=Sulfurimonas sp. TaxID=2022749 RepID=UPI0025EA91D1|nr:hypothetical protein [Sulfurimonas sp.]MCK9472601.1 hypothetical protein [Sulfurimonas sp.]MDD3504936.1 hypothetical protein [Sulfurimonas sp.]
MGISTSSLMLIFFILLFVVSFWKIYAFLPNKQLEDDDTTKEAQEQLQHLMIKAIKQKSGDLDSKELYELIIADEEFDKRRFWRFNQNRLNKLLALFFLQNPHLKNIKDIYKSGN